LEQTAECSEGPQKRQQPKFKASASKRRKHKEWRYARQRRTIQRMSSWHLDIMLANRQFLKKKEHYLSIQPNDYRRERPSKFPTIDFTLRTEDKLDDEAIIALIQGEKRLKKI